MTHGLLYSNQRKLYVKNSIVDSQFDTQIDTRLLPLMNVSVCLFLFGFDRKRRALFSLINMTVVVSTACSLIINLLIFTTAIL
jgi:hypothetical protein